MYFGYFVAQRTYLGFDPVNLRIRRIGYTINSSAYTVDPGTYSI